MLGASLNILGQVAKTAAFGAITGKVVDSVLSSKLNKKNEYNKWFRQTKLDFYTELSQEILSYDINNSNVQEEKRLKELCSKTILILDDKNLIIKIQDYINELNNLKRLFIYKENHCEIKIKNFKERGLNLIIALNKSLKSD